MLHTNIILLPTYFCIHLAAATRIFLSKRLLQLLSYFLSLEAVIISTIIYCVKGAVGVRYLSVLLVWVPFLPFSALSASVLHTCIFMLQMYIYTSMYMHVH